MIRMVTMDKLIANAERIATAAEQVGLDDVAAASRDNIRRYRELRDDFEIGEDI